MVLSASPPDPARLVDEVPGWIAHTRKEAHRALGEVEIGVRRAVDEAASAIAARTRFDGDRETLPTIDEIQEDALRFLGNVGPILDVLADRMVRVLASQLRPLDPLAAAMSGVPEASLRAARAGWDRAIRAYAAAVGQYCAGYVEGGGIAFALWTELPPELAGHTGEVASILAERLSFVTRRAEAVVSRWIADVQRELEDLLVSLAGGPPPAERRLRDLLARARALGVRVRTVPPQPGERWLAQLEARIREIEARSAEQLAAVAARRARLEDLLAVAKQLRVRVHDVPDPPSDRYLDRMRARLGEIAARKGVPLPPRLGGPTPPPAETTADEETQEIPPDPDGDRKARVASLLARAAEVGLDLGQVPPDPSTAWIVVTEAKLQAAIAPQRQDPRGRRRSREAERRARIERLHHQADQLGVPLGPIPPGADDAWLDQAEALVAARAAASPPGAPEEPPGAVLVFEEGTIQEQRFAIGDQPLTIGRGGDNRVRIRDDAGVSRKHCVVVREGGRYRVRDTGSTKGTFVDGQRVDQAELQDGSVLSLGDTRYVFRLRG